MRRVSKSFPPTMSDLWADDDAVEQVARPPKTPSRIDSDEDSENDAPRPTKRPRQTLFLPGGSDDEDSGNGAPQPKRVHSGAAPPEQDIDLDALFGDIDDDADLVHKPLKPVDADELERQMEAQYQAKQPTSSQHQILSSSPVKGGENEGGSGKKGKGTADEKKPKRRPQLLNEALLRSEKGFPELIKNVKDFKVKGKGHEVRSNGLSVIQGFHLIYTGV